MVVTEQEAKKKICPFAVSFQADMTARIAAQRLRTADPDEIQSQLPAATCIGPACMAWEWITAEEEMIALYKAQQVFPELRAISELTDEQLESVAWYRKPNMYHAVYRKYTNEERFGQCGRTHIVEVQTG